MTEGPAVEARLPSLNLLLLAVGVVGAEAAGPEVLRGR
jgi:hypothetical protein